MRESVDFINDLDPIQRAMIAVEDRERQIDITSRSTGPTAALDSVDRNQLRTIGAQVVDADDYKNFQDAAATHRDIKVRGSLHHQRTLLTTGTSDSGGSYQGGGWLPVGQPIPPTPRQRRLFIRNLMNSITTTLNAIPYVLEQGPTTTETGASAVAQGTDKPEVEMDFLLQIAPVTKIAAWIPATTELIEDAPALMGYIDTRLAYMLALREEQQLLYGTGTGAQIKGVLTWNSGPIQNQTQAQASGGSDLPAEVGTAIGKVENVDLEADGVVYNPLDFWAAVTSRHSSHFDNGYGGSAPAVLSQISWGLPPVRSRSMTAGTFAVGAWALSSTIADREETVIRIGNQHASFFTQNKVAILAEERLALLNHRPDGYCIGTV